MATPHRKVLDISHHNDILSWSQIVDAGILGIIHKATEGTSYVDNTYRDRKYDAQQYGLLWGAYHFANGNTVKSQVENFLRTTGLDSTMLYALDWEDEPNGNTMNLEQAEEFVERVDQQIGKNRCVVYSGNTAKEYLDNRVSVTLGAHRLWLAQYGSNPEVQETWDDWWLWQYSDGNYGPGPRGCPGCGGDVDTNSWEGTDSELVQQWAGSSAPPEPSAVPTVSITTSGEVEIYLNGDRIA